MMRAILRGGLASLGAVVLLGSAASAPAACCWDWFGMGGRSAGYSPSYDYDDDDMYAGYSAGYAPSWSGSTYAGYAPMPASYGYGGGCCPTGGCSPCGSGGCPTCPSASYYGPSCCPTGCCPTGCPTGCCPTGGCPTGGCPTGDCELGSSSSGASVSPRPTPADGTPRTFERVDEPADDQDATTPGSRGWDRRDPNSERNEGDVFGPRDGAPYERPVRPMSDGPEAGRSDEATRPAPDGAVIQDRRAAPTDEADFDEGPMMIPVTRRAPLNLDNKITWRDAPQRTRIAVEATYRAPQVARAKVAPEGNDGWAPVEKGTRLVSK